MDPIDLAAVDILSAQSTDGSIEAAASHSDLIIEVDSMDSSEAATAGDDAAADADGVADEEMAELMDDDDGEGIAAEEPDGSIDSLNSHNEISNGAADSDESPEQSTVNEEESSTADIVPGEVESDVNSVDSSAAVDQNDLDSTESEATEAEPASTSHDERSNGTESSENEADTAVSIESTTESITTDSQEESTSDSTTQTEEHIEQQPTQEDKEPAQPTEEDNNNEEEEEEEPPQLLIDYASKVSGAQILESSPSLSGTSNLLTGDIDRYAIAPCADKKYFVIGLSEDILVTIVKIANYERYSSHVKEFQILASQEYPTKHWNDLGTYVAKSRGGEQTFELKEASWARYLKFKFLSHYGVEHYCTVSRVMVHGRTMLQGFHEQWIESEKMDNEINENLESEGEPHEDDENEGIEAHDGIKEATENEDQQVDDEGEKIEEASGDRSIEDNLIDDSDDVLEQETNDQTIDETEGNNEEDVSDSFSESENENDQLESQIHLEEADDADHTASEADIDQTTKEETAADNDETQNNSIANELNSYQVSDEVKQAVPDDGTPEIPNSETDDIKSVQANSPNNETNTKDDNNSTIHGVAKAVKAAVAHVTDELKHVKEAVQSADAVGEIKKMIRTTITDDVAGEIYVHDVSSAAEESVVVQDAAEVVAGAGEESDIKGEETVQSNQNDNSTFATRESKSSNETTSMENNATCIENQTTSATKIIEAENATKIDNQALNKTKTESASKEIENKTAVDKSTNKQRATTNTSKTQTNKTTADKSINKPKAPANTTKAQTNTSLKIDPTATLPRKTKTTDDQIAKLISLYPSASCLKSLDFNTFKSKSLPISPTTVGTPKMEPIFQKITNEIKSVQTTQHQYEAFISHTKSCYEEVLMEMAVDIDEMRNKLDGRLTILEMMVLERRDVRDSNWFGFMPAIFRVSAFLPVYYQSLNEVWVYLAVAVVCILVWRMKKKNCRKNDAVNNHSESLHSPNQHEDQLHPPKITSENDLHEDDMVSPLPIQNISEYHPIPSEIIHTTSCEDSIDSVPSLPHSEPGTTHISRKESHRTRFRMKRRNKSDGSRTS